MLDFNALECALLLVLLGFVALMVYVMFRRGGNGGGSGWDA